MTADPVHVDAVEVLTRWSAPGPDQSELRDRYLATLADHADATRRSCWPEHLTASAVVLDPTFGHVALVLHGKVHLWLQPGGHIEDGDTRLLDAAIREAEEELGLSDLEPVRTEPTSLHRHAAPCRRVTPGGFHLDVGFVLVATGATDVAVSDESDDVAWFGVDALPDLAPEDLRLRVDQALASAVPSARA
jgi:8-oxo-dGTP pyrophosphatase MutT (NUDIX family)